MDALKKAEQEKKEAVKRRELPDETGMHLEKQEVKKTSPEEPAQETNLPDISIPEQSTSEEEPLQSDLSLSPLQSDSTPKPQQPEAEPTPEISETQTVDDGDIIRTMEMPQAASGSVTLKEPDEDNPPVPKIEMQEDIDQSFAGVDLEQTFNAGLFEDTVQGEPFKPEELAKSYNETLPGVPAAQLAKDIGTQDQPTPVAAQTIFTATNTIAKPTSGFRWLLISLAILAVISALIASYFFVTPVSRDMPSPLVARGVETIITQPAQPISPPVTPPQAAQEELVEEILGEADLTEAEVEVITDVVTNAESVSGEIVTDADVTTDQSIGQADISTELQDFSELAQTITESASPPQALPEVIEPPSSMVRITRSSQSGEKVQLIQDAFSAYQSGDYAQAQLKYSEALDQFPDSRDAMLGMAAVAIQTGRQEQALNYYLQLLRRNPLDNIARAAILGHQGGNNSLESISQLKTMIYDGPDQPYLYFTLGKLHADRDNWSEAQQAFFEAYRLDTTNPDFALNLAISLDRLGQSQTALDYYHVALSLAETNPASFQRPAVQSRIDTLTRGN